VTTILLCCLLLILLTGCLYLVAVRPDLVAAWLYRLCRNADPWSRRARLCSRLLAIKRPEVEPWYPTDVAEAEANEAPDPVDEHFSTAPRVVAGQDLDDSILIAELQAAYDDYRAGRDIFAGAPKEI
jgi:hypothetical protein